MPRRSTDDSNVTLPSAMSCPWIFGPEDPFVRRVATAPVDLPALIAAVAELRRRIDAPAARRGPDRLRSISLTHRPGAADVWADGNRSQFGPGGRRVYREADFTEFNAALIGTYFYELYRALPFRVGRMRLMILPALTVYGTHRDATVRAHLAIHTTEHCRLVDPDGVGHHIPADGRLFLANTKLPHTAYNAGGSERVHLAMSLPDTEDPQ